jgi:low temperature requirement protein LtrA
MADRSVTSPPLRVRDGHEAKVTSVELFFDLVYVFAVTQLSHVLLHHLSFAGAAETLILWFAVWLGWQYTCWVTNWFDPDARAIRLMLFALMLAALVMSAAIPQAFGDRGLVFALAYVAIQVGRTVFVLALLGRDHALAPNFTRMLAWLLVSACFWIGGAFAGHELRMLLWAVAVLVEYVSPMVGYVFPGLGRSRTDEWTIEGGHLAERCQLFVIVALGETIMVTGARLSEIEAWDAPILIAFLVAFLGTLGAWWIYFGTSSQDGSAAIAESEDPGRMGAYFHYVHAVLVAGIIVMAVGNDLVLAHPDGRMNAALTAALIGGPAIYLVGGGIYKRIVYGSFPPSHIGGLVALAALALFAGTTDLLMVGGLTSALLLAVALWEYFGRAKERNARAAPA